MMQTQKVQQQQILQSVPLTQQEPCPSDLEAYALADAAGGQS